MPRFVPLHNALRNLQNCNFFHARQIRDKKIVKPGLPVGINLAFGFFGFDNQQLVNVKVKNQGIPRIAGLDVINGTNLAEFIAGAVYYAESKRPRDDRGDTFHAGNHLRLIVAVVVVYDNVFDIRLTSIIVDPVFYPLNFIVFLMRYDNISPQGCWRLKVDGFFQAVGK